MRHKLVNVFNRNVNKDFKTDANHYPAGWLNQKF